MLNVSFADMFSSGFRCANLVKGEHPMRNDDEIKGKGEQIKGNIKQGVGDLTGDTRLKDEGAADEISGEAREGFGTAKRKVGETIEDVGERIKR